MAFRSLVLCLLCAGCASSPPVLEQFHDDPARIADAVELACATIPDLPQAECETLPAAIRVTVEAGQDVSEYVKRAKALLREAK